MRIWLARTGLVLLAASASLGLGACAEERDPINRVQANALPKKFFLGENYQDAADDPEFRTKNFVVNSAVGSSGYSIGEFGAVDRIRWEVTENMLVGRRAYQESPGADNRGIPNADVPTSTDKNVTKAANGTIVAAYKIISHFDVRRSYNPSTGEEQNVIEENTVDRPWNERDYIRVDWTQNLATSNNNAWFGSGKVTPVAYNVTDPQSEDAPHFELENGYLDVTNKFTVEPDEIDFPWGRIPRCIIVSIFTGASSYDCTPQESTTRTSFARVEKDEDFEAFEDNKQWLDVVGNTGGEGDGWNGTILGSARTQWDPQYGWQDSATHRLKSIHNIWQKSHQSATCGNNEDKDHDGTADECSNDRTGYAGSKGSQCDVLANKCTLPVRDRSIKTIAYHLNKEAPDAFQDKLDGAGKVIEQGTLEQMGVAWNQLISVATAYRREVECRRTGDGNRASCHAQFFDSDDTPTNKQVVAVGGWLTDKPKALEIDHGLPSYYVCHNPVREYDPAGSCGEKGSTTRFGDIRKNHLVYWPYESRAHYGGVGWNPPDPVTGETFGATATVMGRSVTRAAAQERDIIQVALGDLTMEDVVAGVPADRYARMLKEGAAAPEGLRVPKTSEQIAAKAGTIDLQNLRSTVSARPAPAGMSALQVARMETASKAKSMVDSTQFIAGVSKVDAFANKLKGSIAQFDEIALPMNGLEPAKIEAMKSWFENDMASKGACFNEASSMGTGSLYLASLAGHFRAKYGNLDPKTRGERIYDDLVKETIKGIGLHEIGHSLGLRHNFASSWDAPNYDPQYWQLRTNEGQSKDACKNPRSGDADSCMGPRYLDPMTRDEQGIADESRPGIDYFANSSTMEYQIERGGESIGLGTYDQHAMKALYGRVLEAFDDRQVPTELQQGLGLKNWTQLQERDILQNGRGFFAHYTQTARLMNVFDAQRDCRPATAEEKAGNAWRVVHGKVCAPSPKEHAAWDDFASDAHPLLGADFDHPPKWHAPNVYKGKELVRWNYRFGEQYGQGGYMHTTMMDAGADIYELTHNLSRSFDLRYPFTYFRRGDREWMGIFLPQSVASQYFSRLRAYHWQVALDISRSSSEDLGDDDGARPYVMAQAEMFNMLTRAALMPEPGNYSASSARTAPGGRSVFDIASQSGLAGNGGGFSLGVGDGRYIALEFENDKGGSWGYQQFWHHAGYETEKTLALMQMVDPRPTLFTVARENYLDGRDVYISFRNDLTSGMDRLIGGILAEDWEAIAPHVTGDASTGVQSIDLASRVVITRPQGAELVFPNIGYKQQLSMAIYATLFSRLSSDMTLANKMRVWVEGDNAPTVPGTREVRFTNPESGYTYIASKYGDEVVDGKTSDKGVGSRVIIRANQLLTAAYQVQTDAQGKPVVDAQGRPSLTVDAGGRPIEKSADGLLAFRRYMGLLDAMRQIGHALDGPLGGAEGGAGSDD